MKYLTKRQRKRKKIQIFNRLGQIYLQSDTESDIGVDVDVDNENEVAFEGDGYCEGELEANLCVGKFPLTTKGIAKDDIKSKLHHQQPQQPQHQQQQQQQQQNGTTTTCENRRMHFGFEGYALPSIDRDLDCYYYRNVPLTLGNFMNLDLLIHRMAERQIARYKKISSSRASSASKGDIDCVRHRQTPAEPAAAGSADASSPLGQSREENSDESVDVVLSSVAINNPYQELTNLTLAMLQNTAFGPLATGSPSTGGNVPSFEFWPHPYQISFFTHTDTDVTTTPSATPKAPPASGRQRNLNLAADALPECSVKPIGYEAKCKSAHDRDHGLGKHQERQDRHQLENGDMWLAWTYHGRQHCGNGNNNSGSNNNNIDCSIDPNPNSIVDSIKCIWKRYRPWESSVDSWPSCWGNSLGSSSIWSVVQPHLHLQQHHQQYHQHQQQHLQYQEDQRSRVLLAAAQLHGCHIDQNHYQQAAEGPAATSFNGNHYFNNNNSHNRSFGNYNARVVNNNRWQYQQQQQFRQQQQQHQMHYVRYNYNYNQNQGLPQEQQVQLAPWQWQQNQNRLGQKPRPHFYPTRFFKSSSYNNLGRKHSKNCCCNGRFTQAGYNSNIHGSNNNPNMEQFMVNLSQEDLEATQMYAIHGERFFEMPMGRRYRRTLYPPALAAAAPTQLQLQHPPLTAMDVYHGNWQSTAMPMYLTSMDAAATSAVQATEKAGTAAAVVSATASRPQKSQMTASVCSDSKLYTANFPPLPTPNQKRVGGHNQKD